jgi:hypothetical protein
MLIDTQLLFSDAQGPFTQATNASTNYLDRLVVSDVGKGEPMWLFILVTEAVVGVSSTCNIRLVTDDNSSFSSATVLWSTGALATTALTIGTTFKVRLPSGFERYSRIEYVVAAADQSAGKFTAFFTRNVDDYQTYKRADYSVA